MDGDFLRFLSNYGIYLFSINLGLSFIGAAIAGKKGYSYGGFLCLGIFVAFWLSLIIAASCKPRAGSRYLAQINQQQYAQPNPYQQSAPPPTAAPSLAENTFACTGCGASVTAGMSFCPNCGKQNPGV